MGGTPSAPQLKDIKAKGKQEITFRWDANCEVDGKWKKDGRILHNGGRINITQPTPRLCFNLTIDDAVEEDEGEYTLELSNWRGQVSGSAKVKLLEYNEAWREINYQENDLVKANLLRFTPKNEEAPRLRFLLHGAVGAGKSSIANSVNTVFQGRIKRGAVVAPSSGTSVTTKYRMHQVKDEQGRELSFVFNDIMGLENTKTGGVLSEDIINALKGHIKDGYVFDPERPLTGGSFYNSNPTLDEKVHCLVSVISAERITLLDESEGIITKMREVKDVAKNLEIPHVVLMTHVDSCCPLVKEDLDKIYLSKKIKIAMQTCSIKLGVSMNCIFPVKNYNEELVVNKKTDGWILNALHNIVVFVNDYVTDC